MPMVMGLLGIVVVIALVFFLMNGKDGDASKDDGATAAKTTETPKSSNLETTSVVKKTPEPEDDDGPQNAYDKARSARFDMATLKPLLAKVDMGKWQEIDGYISEAYSLKADAEKAREGGDEDTFKKLATQAIDTWRKGDRLFEEFQFEVGGIHKDLWDACFQKEERRYANSSKAMRSYMQYETRKH